MTEPDTDTDSIEAFEDKMDELNEGLLEAYCAGFSEAVETFDVDTDRSTDVRSLKRSELLQQKHYYYWDGRSMPLERWLSEEFDS
jgi:hypothetical protein